MLWIVFQYMHMCVSFNISYTLCLVNHQYRKRIMFCDLHKFCQQCSCKDPVCWSHCTSFQVTIGYIDRTVGKIRYKIERIYTEEGSKMYIIGIVVAVVVLIVILIIIIIYMKRRMTIAVNRERDRYEYKMDKMEGRFMNQCRAGRTSLTSFIYIIMSQL